jgi:CRISPR-associated protein Cas1
MRHLTIAEHGQFLGMTGARLVVLDDGKVIGEYPFSRLKTVTIAKSGTSLSGNLIVQCAARGIKLFVLDFRGQAVACLSGTQQHAVAAIRRAQFRFLDSESAREFSRAVVRGKIHNQRAVLLYFRKYHGRNNTALGERLAGAAEQLNAMDDGAKAMNLAGRESWREELLGHEGQAAAVYWAALREAGLFPDAFEGRSGRGAGDPVNAALNYGYAILSSYVWHCLINAGLEVYAGALHTERPGKPSLVLDLMEEYRAWTVDRVVAKLRAKLAEADDLTPALRKAIINGVHETFATRYPYRNRKMTLESILQRQVYRLCAQIADNRTYRPYLFRW